MYKILIEDENEDYKQVLEIHEVRDVESKYILTEAKMPTLEQVFGKESILVYNQELDEFSVEYRDRELMEDEKIESIRRNVLKFIDFESLTFSEKLDLKNVYPKWDINTPYEMGEIVRHEDVLYKIIQAHISQSDWLPIEATSLYSRVEPVLNPTNPEEVINNWIPPTGGHDAYMLGDKILYTDGLVYESTIDNNVWSPVDYPQGWIVVN